MTGELRVLGKEGDTKVIWDAAKEDEVTAARATFDTLKKKGYFGYKVEKDGGKGEIIHQFDPEAEKIIMALPMRGG